MVRSKRFKWRIVSLEMKTIVYQGYVPFAYYVIQKKRRFKLFADWHDVKLVARDFQDCLAKANNTMQELIQEDNNDTNILTYSKL